MTQADNDMHYPWAVELLLKYPYFSPKRLGRSNWSSLTGFKDGSFGQLPYTSSVIPPKLMLRLCLSNQDGDPVCSLLG